MGRLVGRAAEVDVLRACVDRVRAGHPRTIVIEGEAGIGKTALLDVLADLAVPARASVLRGYGVELESDRPFGALVNALGLEARSGDPRRRALAGLLQAQRARRDGTLGDLVPDARYRIVDAIAGLVVDLSGTGPVALLLDDLHWVDESTLLVLRRLARASGMPLLLAVTTRPATTGSEWGESLLAAAATGGQHLHLAALTNADVRALLTDLVGATPGPRLLALADGAGGNPLFVAELVEVLRQDASLRSTGGEAEVADGAAATGLARRLRARAAGLGAEASALVRVAAILRGPFTLEEAARTGGWALADLLGPLDELIESGLLADTGGTLVFRHDLLRRAIEEELPPTARRALHRAAGQALVESGANAVRVARHFALGADHDAGTAVHWLHRAAREAAPCNPSAAVSLLDDALALVSDDAARAALLADRVEALGWSGRNAEAEALARRLLDELEDRPTRRALRRQLALALFIGNRVDEAIEECQRLVAESDDDPAARASALADQALGCMAAGRVAEAEALVTEVLGFGVEGAPLAVAMVLAVRSRLLAFAGDFEASLAAAVEGVDIASAHDKGDAVRQQTGLFRVFTLLDLDRFGDVDVALRDERAAADELGIVWAVPLHHAAAACRHLFTGSLGDAAAEAEAGLTVAEDSGGLIALTWLHAVLALVALHRGELDVAESHIDHGNDSMARVTPLLGVDMHAAAQVRLAEARGDLRTAAAVALGSWDLFEAMGIRGGQRNLGIDAARLAAKLGDRDAGGRIAARLEAIADASPVAADRAMALLARALVEQDPDLAVSAVDAFDPGAHPLRMAAAAEEAARLLWAADRGGEAADVMARSRQAWLDAGASGDARRSAALVAALGLRRPRTPRRSSTGWESLTPTEAKVVAMVADGRGNPAIAADLAISRRTVESHLRHVYAKLGISTRLELAVTTLHRESGG